MNESLLDSFRQELVQIRNYIKHIEQVNELARVQYQNNTFKEFQTHFRKIEKDKKIFEYKAIIISLYGLLEKYIEMWIQEYLKSVARLVSYNKLEEGLREKHFTLSMKLIGMIIEGRWDKYSHLKKEEVLKKLHECIESDQPYTFNTEAFVIQSGNLRHGRIEELFKNLDISLTKALLKNHTLTSSIGLSESKLENTESSVIFSKLNELVDRRNIIAHGASIDDLLNLSEIDEYLSFIQLYCEAIFNLLFDAFIKAHIKELYEEVSLINIFKSDKKKPIIAFKVLKNCNLKLNDFIIIKTSESHFYRKPIKSIQKNSESYDELDIFENDQIGVSIENEEEELVNKNCKFYIKKST